MSSGELSSDAVVRHRFLGFLIWQSIHSTAVYFLSKSLLLSLFTSGPLSPSLLGFISFIFFHLSLLLFSISLHVVSSPQAHRAASPFELGLRFLRFVFVSGAQRLPADFRRRARLSLSFVLFVAASALSGSISIICVCWTCDSFAGVRPRRLVIGALSFRGFVAGFAYGLYYIYKRRWVLEFPIIQRPPFFSFKMRLPLAIRQALKLSSAGYVLSALLSLFVPNGFNKQVTAGKFFAEQIIFYIGNFVIFLCWEISHHLHEVLHTKRFIFAPPKGSAAAETNPSEPLLVALEESTPKSLLQHLAYLDLCMVCEMNVDTWRRAAFFEETSETYKRVVDVCLRPLEQLTMKLSECLESCSPDNSLQLTHQLLSPTEKIADSQLCELFYDFQLYAWCARIVAALTVHSHKEDRFGVAQLSGNNAAVVSTLISCLLAVESCMGKKTNLQSSHYLMGPAGIKWSTPSTGRRVSGVGIMGKRRGSPLYSKAYSMADILRTSIYGIVAAFHNEMLNSAKAGILEKDWIIGSKPLYGTRELLLQKLRLFLDFRAS